jgi:hypothetical protein
LKIVEETRTKARSVASFTGLQIEHCAPRNKVQSIRKISEILARNYQSSIAPENSHA